MVYTINNLSKLAGVSKRALHFYEEIGILIPSYRTESGYRMYENTELLKLQQILFYKNLGYTLKQIERVLGKSNFNQLTALLSHKEALNREYKKIETLIKTVDNTIKHLKEGKQMKDHEIFDGFNLATKAKETDSYFNEEEIVLNSVRDPKKEKQSKEFYDNINKNAKRILSEIVNCITNNQDAKSGEAQKLFKKHHDFTQTIHNATRQVYIALAKLYLEHPVFRSQLTAYHEDLPKLMCDGMQHFANTAL